LGNSGGDFVGSGIPGGACLSGIPDVDWTKNVRVPRGASVLEPNSSLTLELGRRGHPKRSAPGSSPGLSL